MRFFNDQAVNIELIALIALYLFARECYAQNATTANATSVNETLSSLATEHAANSSVWDLIKDTLGITGIMLFNASFCAAVMVRYIPLIIEYCKNALTAGADLPDETRRAVNARIAHPTNADKIARQACMGR